MGKKLLPRLIGWVVGISLTIMSLAVSWALIAGALFVPKVPTWLTMSAGWVLFVLTLIGVVLGIVGAVKKVWR